MEANEVTKQTLRNYVELFTQLRSRVSTDEVALAMLQEIGKDARVERMHGRNGQSNGNCVGNGDVPPTTKQLGFLRDLGVEIPRGLTKRQASEVIDRAREKAA